MTTPSTTPMITATIKPAKCTHGQQQYNINPDNKLDKRSTTAAISVTSQDDVSDGTLVLRDTFSFPTETVIASARSAVEHSILISVKRTALSECARSL